MKTKSFAEMDCSIARTLEHVGSWWSLLIIRDVMMGIRRFKQIEASLGIAKNTLASRLSALVDGGILARAPSSDGSKFEEYVLTDKGRELAPVMIALSQWGDKWAAHPDGPPYSFVDEATGGELLQIWPRRADGERIELNELGLQPLKDETDNHEKEQTA